MARQIGVIPISGTIDELTFYTHPDDGHLVKRKTRVTGERVKTDPNYKLTMLNAAEFTISISSAKLLRKALHSLLFPIADGKLSSRMNQELLKIIQSDNKHGHGYRIPHGNALLALEGFDFNNKLRLRDAVSIPFSLTSDSAEVLINVPEFVPSKAIQAPAYVDQIQLVSGVAVIDFESKQLSRKFWETERIAYNNELIGSLQFRYAMSPPPGHILFAALGVLFYAHLDNIPKDATSQRKRRKVKKYGQNGYGSFTGALSIVKLIPGEPRIERRESRDDEWEMDGLGIA